MVSLDCPREGETVRAVHGGGWPGSDRELDLHIETCAVCREVAAVAAWLGTECRDGGGAVAVPSAARIWWRCQMRARLENTHVAARPLTFAQGLAGAAAAALTAVAIRWAWPSLGPMAARAGARVHDALEAVGPYAGGVVQFGVWMAIGLTALVLVPAVLFWTLSED
jgi:hypothetical protein